MTVIDIILAIFAILILIGAALGFAFILAVVGVTMKRRREGKALPWMCLIRDGECIYPEGDCIDCPVWAKWIERELDDGKQEQRGIPGSDSKRSNLPGRRESD
ncbi:MAG TPA: hypothetical protein H9713_11480 [Candidatus Mediterraneibacter surreyensis]|nr:hypothetical protein [Candidatus Mediterraneibacter surreyensis]